MGIPRNVSLDYKSMSHLLSQIEGNIEQSSNRITDLSMANKDIQSFEEVKSKNLPGGLRSCDR